MQRAPALSGATFCIGGETEVSGNGSERESGPFRLEYGLIEDYRGLDWSTRFGRFRDHLVVCIQQTLASAGCTDMNEPDVPSSGGGQAWVKGRLCRRFRLQLMTESRQVTGTVGIKRVEV